MLIINIRGPQKFLHRRNFTLGATIASSATRLLARSYWSEPSAVTHAGSDPRHSTEDATRIKLLCLAPKDNPRRRMHGAQRCQPTRREADGPGIWVFGLGFGFGIADTGGLARLGVLSGQHKYRVFFC